MVHATLYVEGPLWVGIIQKRKFQRALAQYFDAIQTVLDAAGKIELLENEPAAVQARRVLSGLYAPVIAGPRTPIDEEMLSSRIEAMRNSPVDPAIVDRLIAFVRDAADDEVSQIRPFELARTWELDRREVLRAFLYGAQCGLVQLNWQINCPVCRVGARIVGELRAIDGKSHCGACEIDYDADFARHIEAVFPVNPALRPVHPKLYCASSPSFLPHVFAQLRLAPNATREDLIELPAGQIHLRTLWTRRADDTTVDEARPLELRIHVMEDAIETSRIGVAPPHMPTKLVTTNATSTEVMLLLERSGWAADAVLGTVIASMPEFAGLFATEAPASGVELSVAHIALLFSDLTGSTALYERVGDARAFAMVEDHFRVMESVVTAAGGAIVKTMGDAVMASFPTEREAMSAALQMVETHDSKFDTTGLGVKIGIHAGPCLAVRANDRLDYFGSTVNIAARLQAQAHASEVVITERLSREPAVKSLIGNLPSRPFDASLKGIRNELRLVAIDASRSSGFAAAERSVQNRL
jgi:class 3 adenylate cyclase